MIAVYYKNTDYLYAIPKRFRSERMYFCYNDSLTAQPYFIIYIGDSENVYYFRLIVDDMWGYTNYNKPKPNQILSLENILELVPPEIKKEIIYNLHILSSDNKDFILNCCDAVVPYSLGVK